MVNHKVLVVASKADKAEANLALTMVLLDKVWKVAILAVVVAQAQETLDVVAVKVAAAIKAAPAAVKVVCNITTDIISQINTPCVYYGAY